MKGPKESLEYFYIIDVEYHNKYSKNQISNIVVNNNVYIFFIFFLKKSRVIHIFSSRHNRPTKLENLLINNELVSKCAQSIFDENELSTLL